MMRSWLRCEIFIVDVSARVFDFASTQEGWGIFNGCYLVPVIRII